MLKLPAPKKKLNFLPVKYGSAKLKTNKKVNKKYKKALAGSIKECNNIKKEGNMREWIQTVIMVLVFIGGGISLIAVSATQYEKINSGIKQNSKALTELIEINKSSIKRVSKLERTTDKMEIYVNLNRSEIKSLKK